MWLHLAEATKSKVNYKTRESTIFSLWICKICCLIMDVSVSMKEVEKPEKLSWLSTVFRTMWNKRLCESLSFADSRLARSSILIAKKFSLLTKLTTFPDTTTWQTSRWLFGWRLKSKMHLKSRAEHQQQWFAPFHCFNCFSQLSGFQSLDILVMRVERGWAPQWVADLSLHCLAVPPELPQAETLKQAQVRPAERQKKLLRLVQLCFRLLLT